MKVYIITLENDKKSVKAKNVAVGSLIVYNENYIEPVVFPAVTPKTSDSVLKRFNIKWNYPWNGEVQNDLSSGLKKVGYNTAEPKKRIACFLSHYLLWVNVIENNIPAIICEHDAVFYDKIPDDVLNASTKNIISLNEPQPGATPRAQVYKEKVEAFAQKSGKKQTVTPVPYVQDSVLPAGLPGNSAYYIRPEGAQKLVELTREFGAWPNDAIMCRQLIGSKIGCLYPFISRVQGIESSTTL